MPRQPRYNLPGYPQHVIQRGVNREPVFFCEDDRRIYLDVLLRAKETIPFRLHAYVLMTNHVHLLITPDAADALARLMQSVGRNYVQKINKLRGRTGTLWEGRYKAALVQDDLYLLTCQRYIELNPVRAGLVSCPADYSYSSYAANALGRFNPLITPHVSYKSLGATPGARRLAYRGLFESGIAASTLEGIRKVTNACLVFGDDRFKDGVEAVLGRSVRQGKVGRPAKTRSDPN